jgi:Family of unknown function (DUF6526)
MTEQNYANHKRYVFLYHVVLFGLIVLTLIGSVVNLYKSVGDHQRIYSASLIVVMNVCLLLLFYFAREFALKAQDRAIRAEENLRHFVLTGKPLDARLTIRQVVGLRFAPDEEFAGLAKRAVVESLSADTIKRAVKRWRADTYRA